LVSIAGNSDPWLDFGACMLHRIEAIDNKVLTEDV
jgi:hypothetical protein